MNLNEFKIVDGELYRLSSKQYKIIDRALYLMPSRGINYKGQWYATEKVKQKVLDARHRGISKSDDGGNSQ